MGWISWKNNKHDLTLRRRWMWFETYGIRWRIKRTPVRGMRRWRRLTTTCECSICNMKWFTSFVSFIRLPQDQFSGKILVTKGLDQHGLKPIWGGGRLLGKKMISEALTIGTTRNATADILQSSRSCVIARRHPVPNAGKGRNLRINGQKLYYAKVMCTTHLRIDGQS